MKNELRMPKHYSALERKQRAHEVIEQLGLGKVAHSFIGDVTRRGISGGEKKRVSIGTELVATPFILFLDEPTTGLDSTNAAKVPPQAAEHGPQAQITLKAPLAFLVGAGSGWYLPLSYPSYTPALQTGRAVEGSSHHSPL